MAKQTNANIGFEKELLGRAYEYLKRIWIFGGVLMKKKWLSPFGIVIFVIAVLFYTGVNKTHTFTLTDNGTGGIHQEQIQPLFGTVKVSGDCDTDVVFTDAETGETFTVGYITQGLSEKIKLQRNKWYNVSGAGNIKVSPVNVRIE